MYIHNFTNFTVDSCIYVDPPTGRQALLCQYRLIIWCHKCQIKHAVSSFTTMICLFLMYCVTKEGDDKWWYRYFPANGGGHTHAHSAKVMLQILLTGVPLFQDGSCDMYWYHMWIYDDICGNPLWVISWSESGTARHVARKRHLEAEGQSPACISTGVVSDPDLTCPGEKASQIPAKWEWPSHCLGLECMPWIFSVSPQGGYLWYLHASHLGSDSRNSVISWWICAKELTISLRESLLGWSRTITHLDGLGDHTVAKWGDDQCSVQDFFIKRMWGLHLCTVIGCH